MVSERHSSNVPSPPRNEPKQQPRESERSVDRPIRPLKANDAFRSSTGHSNVQQQRNVSFFHCKQPSGTTSPAQSPRVNQESLDKQSTVYGNTEPVSKANAEPGGHLFGSNRLRNLECRSQLLPTLHQRPWRPCCFVTSIPGGLSESENRNCDKSVTWQARDALTANEATL